ncbi:MAG: FG-GAP repeat domain-containing protein, partial [Planctomycetota bacterium]
MALVDYDGDGDLDVYLVSGWHLRGSEIVERTPNRLYRNRGDGTFEDVTAESGTGDTGWGCGVAVGDVDGDGWPDLHVTNFGPDVLFRNAGDGTFERVEASPGIDGWSAQSVFFDADGDGDEDLFVCGYIEATLEEVLEARPTLRWKGADVMM